MKSSSINRLNSVYKISGDSEDAVIKSPDSKNLTSPEELILDVLGEATNNFIDWVPESTLFKLGKFSPVEIKIAIDELYRRNLIKREFKDRHDEFCVQLTVDGLKLYKIPAN